MHQLTMIHVLLPAPVKHGCKSLCPQVSLPTLKAIHLHTKLIHQSGKYENESINNQHKCCLVISGAPTRRKVRRHFLKLKASLTHKPMTSETVKLVMKG